MSAACTPQEMMLVAAARALAGARTVFVGVGLPNAACNLARLTVAPDIQLIYESGVYGARPTRLPLSIGDPALVSGAISVLSLADLFGLFLQGGRIDVALLGGAQVDRHGNLNTTVIGDYAAPRTRLPGSGGACDIAVNARSLVYIMRLQRRAFVDSVDFVTSPGHLIGEAARDELRMPGEGPTLVVTDLALFDFGAAGHQMRLVSLHPGVTLSQVRDQVGWELAVSDSLAQTPSPTDEELRLMREVLQAGVTSG